MNETRVFWGCHSIDHTVLLFLFKIFNLGGRFQALHTFVPSFEQLLTSWILILRYFSVFIFKQVQGDSKFECMHRGFESGKRCKVGKIVMQKQLSTF